MRARTALLAFAVIGAFVLWATVALAAANPTFPELDPGWRWIGPLT